MAGVSKNVGVHQDRRIEAFHVIALIDIGAPPHPLHVVLQLDAHRPVVPRSLKTPIEIATLEQEPAALTERDNLVHHKLPNITREELANSSSSAFGIVANPVLV